MKKLFMTMLSIALTSLFLVACGSDGGGGSAPPINPYPLCDGYTGYDRERCIEDNYGTYNNTGNYHWTSGNVAVQNATARKQYEQLLLSYGKCNAIIDSDDLQGCKDMSGYINVSLLLGSLTGHNQNVTLTITPTTKRMFGSGSDRVNMPPFQVTGRMYFEGDKIRIHAAPFMLIIQQNKLYESSFQAQILIDGSVLATTSFSYYSSGYYNNNNNCIADYNAYPTWGGGWNEGGGTYCGWGW